MLLRLAPRLLALYLPLGLMACGGKETAAPPGSGPTAVTLSAIKVSPDTVQVAAGLTLQLSARGTYSDGSERDLTADVAWNSSDLAIATISNEDGSRGLLRGLAAGSIMVRVEMDGVSGEKAANIDAPTLDAVSIDGADAGLELERRATVQLTASGAFSDQTTAAIESDLVWSSSDAAIATVSESGLVTGLTAGDVTISVVHGDMRADLAVKITCTYPGSTTGGVIAGAPMPLLHWNAARNPDGTSFALDMKDVYCGAQFPEAKVVFFMVGAGWCPNCPAVIRATNRIAADIQAAGGLLVYTEIQDENYQPSDSGQAHAYINRLVPGSMQGLRVGDKDVSRPAVRPFGSSGEIDGIPFIMAVRVRDMKYITDDRTQAFGANFPFVAIATNPDAYDDHAPAVMCSEGTEEASEPNDTVEQASTITAGQTVQGGICAAAPDYYWVDVTGPWTATLNFQTRVGDLDIFVWDTFADRPLSSRGQVVGSNGNTDTETFQWQDQALIRVEGYQGGQAPYTLSIQSR